MLHIFFTKINLIVVGVINREVWILGLRERTVSVVVLDKPVSKQPVIPLLLWSKFLSSLGSLFLLGALFFD